MELQMKEMKCDIIEGNVSVFISLLGKLQSRTSSVSVRTVGVLSASVLYSAILHSALFLIILQHFFFVVEFKWEVMGYNIFLF